MNPYIAKLASNPNAITLRLLRKMLAQDGNAAQQLTADLQKVLPHDIAQTALTRQQRVMPSAANYVMPDASADRTCFVLWGDKGAGKSTLVSALAATAPGEITYQRTHPDDRFKAMRRLFTADGNDGLCSIPRDGEEGHTQVTILTLKRREGLINKSYPLTFIEFDRVDGNFSVNPDLMKLSDNYVHIFCFDPTADLQQQAQSFIAIVGWLNNSSRKNRMAGLYIVVTKVDTMVRVPADYRAEAARTLITAGQRTLWLKILTICHDLGIKDPQPIPFCVGDVNLGTFFHPDRSYARDLWERPVLVKAMPRLNALQRFLNLGNKWTTGAFFTLAAAGLAYFLYTSLKPDAPYPAEALAPVDYSALIHKRADKGITEAKDYRTARETYDTQLGNINIAHRIGVRNDSTIITRERELCKAHHFPDVTLQRGTTLLNDAYHSEAKSYLDNAFRPVLNAELERIFGASNWDAHYSTYTPYKHLFKEQYVTYIDTYTREIAPAYNKAANCTSTADVSSVKKIYNSYFNTAPYSRLGKVTGLKNRADKSYRDYLQRQVNAAQSAYDKANEDYRWARNDYYTPWDQVNRLGAIRDSREKELNARKQALNSYSWDNI